MRLRNINNKFTKNLYDCVCRSLFEKHKLLFSFLLAVRLLDDQIDQREYRHLIAGAPATKELRNPASSWLTDNSWKEVLALSELPNFQGFEVSFVKSMPQFQQIFDSATPHQEPFPTPWQEKLSPFQKLLVLKCLRPDKVILAIQDFVVASIGREFIEPPPFDLLGSYNASSPTTPLIFILSPGADPSEDMQRFRDEQGYRNRYAATFS